MKRVLLLSNEVFHYREKIYNRFYEMFDADGFEFHVASNAFQDQYSHSFIEHRLDELNGWPVVFDEVMPDCVILFLHIKDKIMFPVIRMCRKRHIPVIYWNHGVNITDPDNKIKNAVFHRAHSLCDALITYSPSMTKYFKKKDQGKLFIANNTLDFSDVNKALFNVERTRKRYGISQKRMVLFLARYNENRKLEVLYKGLKDREDIALVVAGPGVPSALIKEYETASNVYCLGECYGNEASAIYNAADIFSVPGSIGLAVNEAMFWGKPVFLLREGKHGPEISYVRDGINGYIADSEEGLIESIINVLTNDSELQKLSAGAIETYENELSLSCMYEGFRDAVCFCTERKEK